MSSPQPFDDVPASLAGSLSVFTLSDLLTLLASTSQTGEVRVVNELVDGRLWLTAGELSNGRVGAATTIGQAVFELACVTEGWCYFTSGVVSSSGYPAVPVAAVLAEVCPQVDEWRGLLRVMPLEAVVTLSPNPPGNEVQIRSYQWRVLAAVGDSGHSVKAVLDQIGGDQTVGLRTLRDLHSAGLVALSQVPGSGEGRPEELPSTPPRDGSAATLTAPPPPPGTADFATPDSQTLPPPPPPGPNVDHDGRSGGLAEVAMMPPPPTTDPWAPTADTRHSGNNGAA